MYLNKSLTSNKYNYDGFILLRLTSFHDFLNIFFAFKDISVYSSANGLRRHSYKFRKIQTSIDVNGKAGYPV